MTRDQKDRQARIRSSAPEIAAIKNYRSKYLQPLIQALNRLVKQAEEEETCHERTLECWDWDVIKAYIRFNSPREPLAPALRGYMRLKSESNDSSKIVILDGARLEMSRELARTGCRIRQMYLAEKAKSIESQNRIKKRGALSSDEMNIVRREIIALDNNADIRRLSEFLTDHCVYLSELDQDFAQRGRRYIYRSLGYKRVLGAFADRSGTLRNRADALNLTRLSLAKLDGQPCSLVTGTNRILEEYSEIATDPFTALIRMIVTGRFPDPEVRLHVLRRWIQVLNEYLLSYDTIQAVATGSMARISKERVNYIRSALEAIKSDNRLSVLTETLSRASTLARSRTGPAARVSGHATVTKKRGIDARCRNIESQIDKLIHDMNPDSSVALAQLGYRYVANRDTKQFARWHLKEAKRKSIVLTLEVNCSQYSMRWPVDLTFVDFIRQIEMILGKKWIPPRPKELVLETLFDGPQLNSIVIAPKYNKWDLVSHIPIRYTTELQKLRVFAPGVCLYYEAGSLDLTRPCLGAVMGRDPALKWFRVLFRETSSHYVPEHAFLSPLKDRIGRVMKNNGQIAKSL